MPEFCFVTVHRLDRDIYIGAFFGGFVAIK
jgi:hypothetical protein